MYDVILVTRLDLLGLMSLRSSLSELIRTGQYSDDSKHRYESLEVHLNESASRASREYISSRNRSSFKWDQAVVAARESIRRYALLSLYKFFLKQANLQENLKAMNSASLLRLARFLHPSIFFVS